MNPGFASAKLNLWLHVGRRRRDGYHDLASMIVFALDAGDMVAATPAAHLSLEVTGLGAQALSGDDNLVLKAARALARAAGKRQDGARLRLHKALPVAAGLGGGSADAAAALRLLNQVWDLDWPLARLAEVGEAVGADVPVCVLSRPAVIVGKGERVEPMGDWPMLDAVIVNPGAPLLTAEVFARFDAGPSARSGDLRTPLGVRDRAAAMRLIRQGVNDLEPAAIALAPAVGEALDALRADAGCQLARMSGSGASCFGLYASQDAARGAAARLSQARPSWWVRATRLGACEAA